MRSAWLDLPVRTALPELLTALGEHGSAVLAAPPGTGKTTLVPLALAGLLPPADGPPRTVVVAEPRRMAARAAARRMAWLLEEDIQGADDAPGGRIGFTVRGERRAGPHTVVEVVTTGVLLQRLQRDPELPGVDAVLIDECHERHLDADTAAAFLLDVRATLRPDLHLIAASATTDAEAWARLLAAPDAAGPAPVVRADAALHPVAVRYTPPPRPVRPPHGMRVDPALLDHVAATVRAALHRHDGDLLCFLPGVGEIGRVAGMLDGADADVLHLHGRVPGPAQDAVLRGRGTRRRVILATSVAESSLTVPGVRVVVDAGLSREPRTDHARGLGALTTVRSSAATAGQRAGRAGREAPGTAYRCWAQSEDAARPRWPSPEITVADLAPFALQAACWGDPDVTSLALLDPPPAGALAAAREVLHAVGAVDEHGRATERGSRLARLGLHPRLGRALVDGAAELGSRRAAEVVALLSEEPPRAYGDDLAGAWRTARRGGDAYAPRWAAEVRRLQRALAAAGSATRAPAGAVGDDTAAGLVAALAHPERIARRRTSTTFLMASGTAAQLGEGSRLGSSAWLAVAVADRPVTGGSARVRLAAVIDEATARTAGASLYEAREEVGWSAERGDVVARRVTRIGAVELSVRPQERPDGELVRAALLAGLRREGPDLLRWTRDAAELRRRIAFLHRELGEPWPDVSDEALLERAQEWLGTELATARRRADLERVDAGRALVRLLPWATGEAARFDQLAPERVQVPSGSRIRVDYSGAQPVLAVKLQELFGLQETPRIAGGAVPLLVHLLSPAGRPAAVTADLASFWREGYRSVRAELRGRYPKHPWPEDPATAEPTRRTNARPGRD